ncbi:MAG: hypothetical protein KME20_23895 [Kaiparowitsia implicata GSE-PSE-MK54-09C]|jgi:hypothetical protein|nr:hypothetical protein [Kaiparowitsia implicata GSE-PSE-MK54-09C]
MRALTFFLAGLAFSMMGVVSCTSSLSIGEDVSPEIEDAVSVEVASDKDSLSVSEDLFREAVNSATAASEAAQDAQSIDEWHEVANLWSQSIEQMKAVPESHDSYATAQERVVAYQPNLEYAKQNTQVFLRATAQIQGQTVIVSGETNLPNGFIMSVSGSRYHIEADGPHEMSTVHPGNSAKVAVSNGRFQAEVIIPTIHQVKQGLVEFGQAIGDPGLANSPINQHADIYIVGTPMNQDDAILQLVGGKEGAYLVGPNVRESTAFRVADLNLKVEM